LTIIFSVVTKKGAAKHVPQGSPNTANPPAVISPTTRVGAQVLVGIGGAVVLLILVIIIFATLAAQPVVLSGALIIAALAPIIVAVWQWRHHAAFALSFVIATYGLLVLLVIVSLKVASG